MANPIQLPVVQFFDNNGNPLAGGSVWTFTPGTATPKTTWSDRNQNTLNTNPVYLDAAGRCSLFGTGGYRVILKDANGNVLWDHDGSDVANYISDVNITGNLAVSGGITSQTAIQSAGPLLGHDIAASGFLNVVGKIAGLGGYELTGDGFIGGTGTTIMNTVAMNGLNVQNSIGCGGTVSFNLTGNGSSNALNVWIGSTLVFQITSDGNVHMRSGHAIQYDL